MMTKTCKQKKKNVFPSHPVIDQPRAQGLSARASHFPVFLQNLLLGNEKYLDATCEITIAKRILISAGCSG